MARVPEPDDERHAGVEAMRKVALIGAGVTKFGVRKATYRDLIWEAGKACFDSVPGVKPRDIEGVVVGSVMPERTVFQSHIASMAAEALGIRPSALSARTEHMCASGTVGIRYAYAFIAAGLADLVMVLGVEKLNQPTSDEALLNMGAGVDREWEAAFGLTAPPCFAFAAQRHMAEYGTTEEQLALVGVKNHAHASRNPNAHFQKGVTLDQVLCSRMISTPLRLFMCSPITDGAAAVILASEDRARALTDRPVWIRGTGQALDGFQLTSLPEDYAHWPALGRAAQSAYRMAGITARDVEVAEVHDCFAIAELIAYEELGFCAKGEAGPFVEAGRSDYGGAVVVNPRGGLIGCGHPLGATGVAQAAEIFAQLRGEAGARQVPEPTIGLAHNNSGMGEHVVMIYGTE
jgi:acetyl-CoA C-acetyltransferase